MDPFKEGLDGLPPHVDVRQTLYALARRINPSPTGRDEGQSALADLFRITAAAVLIVEKRGVAGLQAALREAENG
jgi:hypothetical protein